MLTHKWVGRGEFSAAAEHHLVMFYREDSDDDADCVGSLTFQDGPVAEHGVNGTTNEEVIQAVIERVEALNQPPYESGYNSQAIVYLKIAVQYLEQRTRSRVERGVEGTSTP